MATSGGKQVRNGSALAKVDRIARVMAVTATTASVIVAAMLVGHRLDQKPMASLQEMATSSTPTKVTSSGNALR
jgi:hypothetical protein